MAYLGKTREPVYFFHADRTTIDLARHLRKHATPAESVLWKILKAKKLSGAKFRRQHPIGNYIADFYCHEARLVIEVDGPIHETTGRRDHDRNRDAEMDRLGILVIRFTNNEILQYEQVVIEKIKEAISRARGEAE